MPVRTETYRNGMSAKKQTNTHSRNATISPGAFCSIQQLKSQPLCDASIVVCFRAQDNFRIGFDNLSFQNERKRSHGLGKQKPYSKRTLQPKNHLYCKRWLRTLNLPRFAKSLEAFKCFVQAVLQR